MELAGMAKGKNAGRAEGKKVKAQKEKPWSLMLIADD